MSVEKSIVSPRLESLRQAIKAGKANALDVFWQNIGQQGAPLIEIIEDDDDHSLVTFLWRAREITGVALISLLTSPTTSPMARLLDTDLWYKTCRVRNDIRATYQFSPQASLPLVRDSDSAGSPWASWRPDPLNPRSFAFFDEELDPPKVTLVRSILEMPAASPQPWIASRDGVPRGRVELHRIGSDILGNERSTWVYTPSGYAPDTDEAYGLVIFFDGGAYLKLVPTTTILDNLIAEGRIPPVVAVLLDSVSLETRMRELILHQPFNAFLVTELLPWIRAHYHITADPRKTVLAGSSAGGLAAAFAGFEHPDIFGNILSQSGAFRLAAKGEEEPEWLARQFAERERLPLRFYLDAGVLEVNSLRDLGNSPSLLTANRHLRNVLRAKGYEVHYTEFAGGHDYISWQGTLADGLQALIGSTAAQ